ncbi:hypothetical protein [Leptospira interrogans]|uniref:hypothetical protein n=1 Tax=Leptospira interrogans TaxID=173 RepID=UPI0018DEDE8D|nr:hypothetical protein [Leptospira interrogans]
MHRFYGRSACRWKLSKHLPKLNVSSMVALQVSVETQQTPPYGSVFRFWDSSKLGTQFSF